MDRVDKSVIRSGNSSVIIKRWVKQDARPAEGTIIPVPITSESVEQGPDESQLRMRQAEELERSSRMHAEKLIDSAQDRADIILETAESEAEQIRQTAQEEGYAQGLAEAQIAAERQREELAEETRAGFQTMLQELRARETARDEEMEGNILRLSLEIAEKIVHSSLEKDDALFKGMIREAVSRLNAKEKFSIHLNQREYDRFFAEGDGWLADALQAAPFTAMADEGVPPGGITLISQEGMVRAGVDTQMENIRKEIFPEEAKKDETL